MAQQTKDYWIDKEARAIKAQEHTAAVAASWQPQIQSSISSTQIYKDKVILSNDIYTRNHGTLKVTVEDLDTVGAIVKYNRPNIAALNFASYTNPGGMFIKGSRAQEECLCHASFLYNVLQPFQKEYYDKNYLNKNKGLYLNRALYSPDIYFFNEDKVYPCDIITCAAPNWSAAHWTNATREENYQVLQSRIKFILDIALDQHAETLVLGAYGCGVFRQNPRDVATIFKNYLKSDLYKTHFNKIIFAIPDGKNGNLNAFLQVFRET